MVQVGRKAGILRRQELPDFEICYLDVSLLFTISSRHVCFLGRVSAIVWAKELPGVTVVAQAVWVFYGVVFP